MKNHNLIPSINTPAIAKSKRMIQRRSVSEGRMGRPFKMLDDYLPEAMFVLNKSFRTYLLDNKMSILDIKRMKTKDVLLISQKRMSLFISDHKIEELPSASSLVLSIICALVVLENIIKE